MGLAKWSLDYFQGDDGYSDGTIEVEVLDKLKAGMTSKEIIDGDKRWPIVYHLSPLRENILNWYSFSAEAELLEVGAGWGALTGLLCRNVKNVTAVELTKIRSEINYERNKEYENLHLITGNFHNVEFTKKFDYIILNGVLEYAASFSPGETPYTSFLKTMKGLLKEDGVILIAIENRLGLKYFNGAKEDHTAEIFSGLSNYAGIEGVRTFSHVELENLVERAGFENKAFYYPHYDYKFPEAIYSEETINDSRYFAPCHYREYNRATFFDEQDMIRTLGEENIRHHYANSFFLELCNSNKREKDSKIIYSKHSNYRNDEFAIITQIVQNGQELIVKKTGLNSKSDIHLNKMVENSELSYGKYKHLPVEKAKKGVVMPFLEGATFERELLSLLSKDENDIVKIKIHEYYNSIIEDTVIASDYHDANFTKVFGDLKTKRALHCRQKANIDLIFSNIFIDDNKIIDYEWVFDFHVPMEFVFWRAIHMFYASNPLVHSRFTENELLAIAQIDDKALIDIFTSWNNHFQDKYVGNIDFDFYARTQRSLTAQINALNEEQMIVSALYIDTGSGFSEETAIFEKVMPEEDGLVTSRFQIPEDIEVVEAVRWDPCNVISEITLLDIDESIELEADGVDQVNGNKYLFLNNDPKFLIKGEIGNRKMLVFRYKVNSLSQEDITSLINEKNQKCSDLENQKLDMLRQCSDYQQHLAAMERSLSWKVTKPLRKVKGLFAHLKDRLV